MQGSRALGIAALVTVGLIIIAVVRVSSAQQPSTEETISGAISATRMITQNARLTGDVTCTVTGAPCIQFGAPGLTLNLAGFTITGQSDPATGCQGAHVGNLTLNEDAIAAINQADETIQGPGIVQRFKGSGVFLLNSIRSRVAHLTASTNCMSGILVNGSSDNLIESNVSVRNGTADLPCGGV